MNYEECIEEVTRFSATHNHCICTVIQKQNGRYDWFLGTVDAPDVMVVKTIGRRESRQ